MKSTFKLNLGLILFCLLIGQLGLAQAEEPTPNHLVEVEINQDNLAPYKQRRDPYSINFSLNYEHLELKNYQSVLDNMTYSSMFNGEALPLIGLGLAYQYNFFLGSLSLGVNYGMGSISGSASGVDRSLDITKYGGSLRYTADMIMQEPYLAPYLGLQMWQFTLDEKSPTDSFSGSTQWGTAFTLGLLIQLNWIDWDTARQTTFNWGLENTFLDIFLTKYGKTNSDEDPNTETDFVYGAGLHLEF